VSEPTACAVLRLTTAELAKLGEYSLTVPTGTTIGKRWKRNLAIHFDQRLKPHWIIGEYYDIGNPDRVGIRWYDVELTDANRPRSRLQERYSRAPTRRT
jgi:hypothetical protein